MATMTEAEAKKVFKQFENLKVLVVGDVMLDAYVHGRAKRISPEAPVPVVHVARKENRLGGAANVAQNVKALGATPILCSIVGEDTPAEIFSNLLSAEGVDGRGLIKSSNRQTTVKTRVVSGGQQLVRFDEEDQHPLDPIDKKALIQHIADLVADCDVLIFEDYDKGTLDGDVISASMRTAHKAGKIVAVDPKKNNFLKYQDADLFKPNLRELMDGLGVHVEAEDLGLLRKSAELLQEKIKYRNALITLSEKGIFYHNEDHHDIIATHVRNVADVSGAGDTVISVGALALAAGLPLPQVSEMANMAGGIVCEYPGVVPIDRDRFLKELTST